MTLTRWKLLAGVLGLSMVGVAALADPPCKLAPGCCPPAGKAPPAQTVSLPPLPTVVLAEAVQVAVSPPVAVPPPKPDDVPALPPLPSVSETKPPAPPKVSGPAPTLKAEEITLPPLNPAGSPKPDNPFVPPESKPAVPQAKPTPLPKPAESPKPDLPALPSPAPVILAEPPPAKPSPPKPAPPASPPVVDNVTRPEVRLDPPATTFKADAVKLDLPPADPAPAKLAPPAAPEKAAPATPAPSDPGVPVRVQLTLGAGPPRFEVLNGDDVLLKVVSDKVQVSSSAERNDPAAALKAAGGVRFSATGLEGSCDELSVVTGTGEVVLAGNVRVKCKQGKARTEIVAGRMTFRLGASGSYSVSDPPGVSPTGFANPAR